MRWECLDLSRSGADCRVPRGGTQVQSEELGRTSLKSHPGSVAVYAPWAMCTSGWDFPSFPQSRIFDSGEARTRALDPGGKKGERHQGAERTQKGEGVGPKTHCQNLFSTPLGRTASFFRTRQ